jgi:hypothetical protein
MDQASSSPTAFILHGALWFPDSSDSLPAGFRLAILWNVIGIIVCGGLGGVTAWAFVGSLGLSGTPGAIAAALVGMVVAVALWAGVTSLLRMVGWIR